MGLKPGNNSYGKTRSQNFILFPVSVSNFSRFLFGLEKLQKQSKAFHKDFTVK